jgi:hypothetical protein
LSTQRSSKNATNYDDQTIAGIVVKAEIGLFHLLPLVSLYFQLPVIVEGLYIPANKQAAKGFKDFWRQQDQEQEAIKLENEQVKEN